MKKVSDDAYSDFFLLLFYTAENVEENIATEHHPLGTFLRPSTILLHLPLYNDDV